MLYENGKVKKERELGNFSIDLSSVERLIKESNAELLASIVGQLKTGQPQHTSTRSEEDFSKETISRLAQMIGETSEENEVKDISKKTEMTSDLEKDKNTIDILRSL